MRYQIKGLYAITDTANLSSEIMLIRTEEILRAGAKLLQYRNKLANEESRFKEANQLLDLCRQYSVPLIINDNIALTVKTGADGVHLGRTDSTIADARECLGDKAMIGCSCYNDLDRAQRVVKSGADYIAFGAFFPSPTKPDAVQAKPEIIQKAKQQFDLPIVAIGGITPENGQSLINAGADMLAVISGLYTSNDPFNTTKQYINMFKTES